VLLLLRFALMFRMSLYEFFLIYIFLRSR
jgi:hypothetical protein